MLHSRLRLLSAVIIPFGVVGLLVAGCNRGTAGEDPAGSVQRSEALATLTAAAGAAAAAPGSTLPSVVDVEPSGVDSAAARQTRAAADATAGIADVGALVDQQVPLATFTPGGAGVQSGSRLLYARGGALRVAGAGGGASEPLLEAEAAPALWTPPEDPGRAWQTEDGRKVAFFAGPDAELWMADVRSGSATRLSGPNLPTDMHEMSVLGRMEEVRLRPGQDYTVVCLPAGDTPLAVFVDDNSRHVRGEARLRVIHASPYYRDDSIDARVNGVSIGRIMAYGRDTGDGRVASGQVQIELLDDRGASLALLPSFTAADKDLKTVFLYGTKQLEAFETSYEPGSPPSGNARVRVFNATDGPVDVTIDGLTNLAKGLASGGIGDYVSVPSVLSLDDRERARMTLYGLRSSEEPVAWSPNGDRIAFVGVADGRVDLYVADTEGNVERLSDDANSDINPRWAPDGKALVWESVDDSYDVHHVRVWRDGGAVTLDLGAIAEEMNWPENANIQFPGGIDWADDRRIFLYPKAAEGAAGLWLLESDGSGGAQLVSSAVTEVRFSREAQAWALAVADRPGELVAVDLEGRQTVVASGEAHFPIWSPDGGAICWAEGASTSTDGWRLHVVDADGTNDRVLTDWLPILQEQPPVPGPNAKRWWLDDAGKIAFTRAGRDYGAAERAGGFGSVTAGNDIENVWIVATDGKSAPVQATDLTQVFYLSRLAESPDGKALALVGFSYQDRSQQLWTLPSSGGKPTKIDGDTRWFAWLP